MRDNRASRAAITVGLLTLSGCGLDQLASADVGEAPTCLDLATWPAESAADEVRLVELVGETRARGTTCGMDDVKGVEQLELSPALHCAARRHAADLARHPELGLSHDGSDGSTTLSRVNISGYEGITRHEIVAANYTDARLVLDAWLADADTCELLMEHSLDEIAAGQARSGSGDRIVWVVLTGQLRQ